MTTAGIRTGAQYLEGLRDDREIWTRGTRVQDVTAEPGMAGGAASLAGFWIGSMKRPTAIS
jgi:aromatic ring hydroxylase